MTKEQNQKLRELLNSLDSTSFTHLRQMMNHSVPLAEIAEKNQNTIATIFAKEGESGFRKYEEEVITQLVKEPQTVISTGGGVVTNHKLRKLLKQTCTVFYLEIDIRTQMSRVKKSNSRPLLKTNNLEETLQKIHALRNNLYRETAHHIINVNNKSINHIVKEIIGLIP